MVEKVPFVLSGGGARGAAHIGVLRAFAEVDIIPSAISGTSAGALVGAFFAAGPGADAIDALLRDAWRLHQARRRLLRGELFTQHRIREFLEENLPARRFEDLRIPFHVTATDLVHGGQRIFSSGDLIAPLLASSAVPFVFPSVPIDGTPYVDGGLSNNLPVEPFEGQHDRTIAVHVNPLPPWTGHGSLRFRMDRIFHLSFRPMVERSAVGCRLFVEPPGLVRFGMFDMHHLQAIQAVGHADTTALLRKWTAN